MDLTKFKGADDTVRLTIRLSIDSRFCKLHHLPDRKDRESLQPGIGH